MSLASRVSSTVKIAIFWIEMCTEEGSRHDAMGEVVIAPQKLFSTQRVITNQHVLARALFVCNLFSDRTLFTTYVGTVDEYEFL